MKKLTSLQRSYLRKCAHHIDPIVHIGKNGLSTGTKKSINNALEAKELIKIKFLNFKEKKRKYAEDICASENCHIIGIVGNIVILFRQQLDKEKQNYKLL